MNYQIEEKTLAAMRAIYAACIPSARIAAPDGDYMLQFDGDRGDACWYLDVDNIVHAEAAQ